MKFHSDETGDVRRCVASARACPFSFHGETAEDSRRQYEHAMSAVTVDLFSHGAYRNVRKMPALFVIDRRLHRTTRDINAAAAWIFEEPSTPTRKRDGTSITVTPDGAVYARRSVKAGKTVPPGYIEAELDPVTGHSFGLEPAESSAFNKMLTEALGSETLAPGTYELCGPKINGNPEVLDSHRLLRHGEDVATEIPPMTEVAREDAYDVLQDIFAQYHRDGIEGVVWHGGGDRRAKLRVKDFFGDPHRR